MNVGATEEHTPHQNRPLFGQLLQYLRGLGFTTTRRADGVVDCREPVADTVLLFRGRPDEEPIRDHELFLTRTQLAVRGLVAETEFDRFVEGAAQPAT
jgi:hypothetical protein